MDFEKYPFDKHECKQFFGSTGYGVAKMVFEGTHSYSHIASASSLLLLES
jgi:hypothetical protein